MLFRSPFVDLRNQFHVDHIFPSVRFTAVKLRKENVPEDRIYYIMDHAERLGNLQLLEGGANNEKRAKLPAVWLKEWFNSDGALSNYCHLHDLQDVPGDVVGFEKFYLARRDTLKGKISAAVNDP